MFEVCLKLEYCFIVSFNTVGALGGDVRRDGVLCGASGNGCIFDVFWGLCMYGVMKTKHTQIHQNC